MSALKLIGNFFAYMVMGLGISLIFVSMIMSNIISTTENIDTLLVEEAQSYIADHDQEIRDYISDQTPQLNTSKLEMQVICAQGNLPIKSDICSKIDSLTEEEMQAALNEDFLDNLLDSGMMDEQIQAIAQDAKAQATEATDSLKSLGDPKTFLSAGIMAYVAAIILLLTIARFNPKLAAYKTARNTFLNTLPFVLILGYIALITPTYLISLITKITGDSALAQLPKLMVELIASVMLSVIKGSTNPVFTTAIAVSAISLAAAVGFRFLLKTKPAPKDNAKSYKEPAANKK